MKIAIATDDFDKVAAHAGQARRWLLYDCEPGIAAPAAQRIELERRQVFHHWDADEPHPLDAAEVIVARSAGDGFLRRMRTRGVSILLTSETDAAPALQKILAGEALADPRWDVSQLLCRLRDLFSKH